MHLCNVKIYEWVNKRGGDSHIKGITQEHGKWTVRLVCSMKLITLTELSYPQ